MAKKTEAEIAEAEYLKTFKLVFSSISRRIANTAYFTPDDTELVLTNPTSPPKTGSKAVAIGDRLSEYGQTDLTSHLVITKHGDFIKKTKEWVFEGINLQTMGYFNFGTYLTKLSKTPRSEIPLMIDDTYRKVFTDGDADDYKNVVSGIMYDYCVTSKVTSITKSLKEYGSEEHLEKYPHIEIELTPSVLMNGKEFYVPVDLSKLSSDYSGVVDVFCTDGLSVPSLREFVAKRKEAGKCKLLCWIVENKLMYCSIYEDDDFIIKSWQPNNFIYLFSNGQTHLEKCHE